MRTRCLTVLLASTVALPAIAFQAQSPQPTVTPVADHHVHLRSPAMTELFGEQIPAVALPQDLRSLLRDFETNWRARDAAALASLFAPNGVMQVGRDWKQGPAGIHLALLGRGGRIRFHAQTFGAGATHGYIAGSYAGDAEVPPGDLGRFLLALERTAGGPWRLSAASLNNLPAEVRTPATTVDEFVEQLDAAGIRHAAVLSWAYQFGAVGRRVTDEAAKVRAENDWTAEQVARFRDRLVGLCSFNPLKPYALDELDRCMRDSRLAGVKLHFTTAGIDLRNPEHVARLRAVFRAADARRFPIVVHLRTLNPAYGRPDAEVFLDEVVTEASHSGVYIAHLAGWGGYGPETDAAMEVFANAAAAGDPRTKNLYFDLSGVVSPDAPDDLMELVVRRIRQVGTDRILFAIDGPVTGEPWNRIRTLPLTAAELSGLARNLAPYLRSER